MRGPRHLEVSGIAGLPEIRTGEDLGWLIAAHAEPSLQGGDVVVVTSKVISKARGLIHGAERTDLVQAHTDRLVALRGATQIVRTRHGLTVASAGLDASNTAKGTVLALPDDPDAEAVALRRRLQDLTGANVAVVVTDTAGRAWRLGQTDMAIGVAGLLPLHDLTGESDGYGNTLAVTAPAVVDAVAAAADLVQGKLERVPVAVVTGLATWVLARDDDGPGAAALIRPEADDLFGWGAADAVRVAVRRDDPDRFRGFARPAAPASSLMHDAMAAADLGLIEVRPVEGAEGSTQVWEVRALRDSGDARAIWEAACLVERLRALAVSTRRELEVTVGEVAGSPPRRLARVSLHETPAANGITT